MARPTQTPRSLGYRMPAEWEPHAATWLSWPRREGQTFPDNFERVVGCWVKMCEALGPHEEVHVNVRNLRHESAVRVLLDRSQKVRRDRVFLHRFGMNECWCRDHGPTFVTHSTGASLAVIDWKFNAWGGKYWPYGMDDAIPRRVARLLGTPLFQPRLVLEGGSIDVNGRGSVLTTEQCLLNKNRNPHLTKRQIEKYLRDYLNVTHVLWLGEGIVGDDTDGHVDDLSRFVTPTTVVTAVEDDPRDVNYAALQDNLKRLRRMKDQNGRSLRIVKLPMPGVVEHRGIRLPASYANFYIANGVVLMPTFSHRNDKRAAGILQRCFPTRKIVGIDSRELIRGRGAIHCVTQQQPRVR